MAPPKPDPAYDAMLKAFEAGARGQQTTSTVNNNYFSNNSTGIGHNAPSSTAWTAPPPQNYPPQNYQLQSYPPQNYQLQSYPLQSYYYPQQGYSNNLYPPICPPGQMFPQYVDNRFGKAVPYHPSPSFMPWTAPPPMQSYPPPGFWPPQGYPQQVPPQQGYPQQGYPQQGYYNNYSPVF